MAQHQCFAHGVDPQFAGAAIVVDLVASIGAEEVVGRVGAEGVAIGIEGSAVRVDHVVVDEGVAVGTAETHAPVRTERALDVRSSIKCVEGIGLRPWLETEHHRGIDGSGDRCSTQQLIARFGALHLVLIFEIGVELRVCSELPSCRQRHPCRASRLRPRHRCGCLRRQR